MISAVFAPKGTYIFEYADCDEDRCHCAGEILNAWYACNDGLRKTETTPDTVPDERCCGEWYRFARVHFYISPDADWIVCGRLAGPRAGSGGCWRVAPDGDGFQLFADGPHWKS